MKIRLLTLAPVLGICSLVSAGAATPDSDKHTGWKKAIVTSLSNQYEWNDCEVMVPCKKTDVELQAEDEYLYVRAGGWHENQPAFLKVNESVSVLSSEGPWVKVADGHKTYRFKLIRRGRRKDEPSGQPQPGK